MKKYIKPVIECDNMNQGTLLAGSIKVSKDPADKNYPGGGDAKFSSFYDDDDDED